MGFGYIPQIVSLYCYTQRRIPMAYHHPNLDTGQPKKKKKPRKKHSTVNTQDNGGTRKGAGVPIENQVYPSIPEKDLPPVSDRRDDTHQFAQGLTDFLFGEKMYGSCPTPFKANADPLRICQGIEQYLQSIEELPITYTRNQMIADLIILLKKGNAGVSGTLVDMMGFSKVQDAYIINTINYGDIEDRIENGYEPDPS